MGVVCSQRNDFKSTIRKGFHPELLTFFGQLFRIAPELIHFAILFIPFASPPRAAIQEPATSQSNVRQHMKSSRDAGHLEQTGEMASRFLFRLMGMVVRMGMTVWSFHRWRMIGLSGVIMVMMIMLRHNHIGEKHGSGQQKNIGNAPDNEL